MDVHPTKNVSIGIDPYPYWNMGSYGIILIYWTSATIRMPFGDSQPPVTVGIAKDSATFRGKHAPQKKVLYTTLDIWIMMDCIFRQTSILLSVPTKPKRSPTAFCAAEGSPALLAIFRHVLLQEIADIKVPRSHKNYHKNYQLFMAHVLPSSKKHMAVSHKVQPRDHPFFHPSSKNSL